MNKTFKLYQIHINKQEHDKINAEGHDSVPKHKASPDMKIGLKKDIQAWQKMPGIKVTLSMFKHYCKGFGRCIHVGNVGPEEQIDRIVSMYSFLGDIVEDENGKSQL